MPISYTPVDQYVGDPVSLPQPGDLEDAVQASAAWETALDRALFDKNRLLEVLAATRSAAGLALDGTGNNTVTAHPNQIVFTGVTNPVFGTSVVNRVLPINTCKAWALVSTDGATGITIVEGIGISGVSIVVNATIQIGLTDTLDAGNYGVLVSPIGFFGKSGTGPTTPALLVQGTTTTSLQITGNYLFTGFPAVNFNTDATTISICVYARATT